MDPFGAFAEDIYRYYLYSFWKIRTNQQRSDAPAMKVSVFAQILTKLKRDFRASVIIQKGGWWWWHSCNYKLCCRNGRSSVPSKCQQFSLRSSSCSKRVRAGPSVCYLSCGGVARCLLPLVLDNIAFIIFIMLLEHDLSLSSPGSAVVDFTALLATF